MTSASSKSGRPPASDPAHDVLHSERHPLDAMFSPRTVAVVGASERPGSAGRNVLWNLLSHPFGGTVFPVNSELSSVLGIRGYPTLGDVPEQIELAIVCNPAPQVPDVISECVSAKVPAAIIMSNGFREKGPEGADLERQVQERLKGSRMRVLGPNSLGVMNPLKGLNATWAQTIARPGNVAFVSQSIAMCTAILDWSLREMVGFSAFVSVGSMLDVSWGDLIDYLGDDQRTKSIVMYMESLGNAREFLSAAREVSLTKPIIVIKAGRTEGAAKAVTSHIGILTGSYEVLEAAFARSGVLRVTTVADLFYMAEVLGKQPRPRGPRLCIVTNAGGPGVVAADALLQLGGELATLAPESVAKLSEFLPPEWSHANPVDIARDAEGQRFAQTLEVVTKDPGCDGVLVIAAPQGMIDLTSVAESLKSYAKTPGKPLLASFMGGAESIGAVQVANQAGIPCFPFPDTAARAFSYMWKYTYNLRGLYETPSLPRNVEHCEDSATAEKVVLAARRAERVLLSEFESKQVLAAYGIPVAEARVVRTCDEAIQSAREIGYPVVLKLFSETITHKTDVGGVQLNLGDAAAVRRAYQRIQNNVEAKAGGGHFHGVTVQGMVQMPESYELILGSSLDRQFGPVLLFGSGGQLVEVYRDRSLALPPLNTTLARRMMEQTRIWPALKGARGRRPVDTEALEELLVRFSQLVVEQPWIREIDINPLLVSPTGMVALDARVVLHSASMAEADLPKPAIRPYPTHYVDHWRLKDGTEVLIRPIRPEDEPLMIKFHERLSDRSVYLRYFQPLKLSQRTAHERLTRICFIDYDREMALVVEKKNEQGEPEVLAVGRLSKLRGVNEAECAVLVRDEYQHQGIGSELYRRTLRIAKEEKIGLVVSTMLLENREMQAICKKLGFRMQVDMEDELVHAEIRP